MNMPGMHMPMPVKSKSAAKKKRKRAPTTKPVTHGRHRIAQSGRAGQEKADAATPAAAMQMNMPMRSSPAQRPRTMAMPMPTQPAMPPMGKMQAPHSAMTMPTGNQAGHMEVMSGALGSYPMERESSGTAWQPDSSQHSGLMSMSGDWTLMAHGVVNLVVDHQSGPRGDDEAFISGMLMGMAQRPLGNGRLQLRAMLSPDPLMGPRGYPLLLASGETANGRDRLIDRQHPHDFFMELSASASQDIGKDSSVFLYAGLPGEPAFGPPTFMHRESILDSPEAPITHHWLDSTHITFGVVTAGVIADRFKVEASRFNAREPDQHRWDIETGPLDSTSIRLSWNPTRTLALQGSWARLMDPEQLEPGINQTRWSASALWAKDVAPGWHAAATLAWGRKSSQGHNDDGVALEGSLKHGGWTVFGRGEWIENRELILGQDEPAYKVSKISLGAVRDFRMADHLSLGAGGLIAVNFVPAAIAPLYGGSNPTGVTGFLRLKLD